MKCRSPSLFVSVSAVCFLVFPAPVSAASTTSSPQPTPSHDSHAPIPVKFILKEPEYVTLVVDDAQGKRVRNLISETLYPAGANTVWWDGLDESGRVDVSPRGSYKIEGKLVDPGTYRVRGLVRKQLDLSFEFAPYNPGNPPWPVTENKAGGWLADHSPPSEVLFVPGPTPHVLIGSYIVEGGSSLTWVDLQGHKTFGMGWLGGGNWTGASNLARDVGNQPLPGLECYAGTTWPNKWDASPGSVELRLIAIENNATKPVLIYAFPKLPGDQPYRSLLGGLAARDGLIFATLPSRNQLLVVDASAGKLLATYPVSDIRGIAFDAAGELVAVVGRQLQRFEVPLTPAEVAATPALPAPQILVTGGLDDPQRIAIDSSGSIYVTDRGQSHDVKVFAADGSFLHLIGKPGAPSVGPYDPERMNNPSGITVSSDGHVWVAESDEAPRRVSVWKSDGTFVRAFYGGVRYGGGGQIDPRDPNRYYYGPEGYGMEFQLDWAHGTDRLVSVYYRPSANEPFVRGSPETPIYAGGRQYMTNANNDWLMGTDLARLWVMRNGAAVPVAMAGGVLKWPGFEEEPFKSLLPKGDTADPVYQQSLRDWFFAWSDRNGDGKVEPDEITLKQLPETLRSWISPVTVEPDLSMLFGSGYRLTPSRIDKSGVPLYDWSSASPAFVPTLKNRFAALDLGDHWIVQNGGPICGYHHGQLVWTYPCRWPGLTAMYYDPLDEPEPGQVVGLTRLLGPPINVPGSDAGPIWASNANNGTAILMTRDGLYVGTLGHDSRVGRRMQATNVEAQRGLSLSQNTLGEEHFFINLCQTPDGKVYLVTAFGIVRVDHLATVRRLPDQPLVVTPQLHDLAANYLVSSAAESAQAAEPGPLPVPILAQAPALNGNLDPWTSTQWATICPSRNKKTGDGRVQAALAISGDRLYAAYRTGDPAFQTGDPDLLASNTGGAGETLFKMGGALDLMLGTNPSADPKRTQPVAGDIRLLVTRVNGRTVAALYRAVVPGTVKPVPFSSPWRTITLDRVDDVSSQVALTTGANRSGTYLFSIPLATLGLSPAPGQTLRGDIGILRGDAGATVERVYWHNKATGLTADVPGEAMLTPNLWGDLEIGTPDNS